MAKPSSAHPPLAVSVGPDTCPVSPKVANVRLRLRMILRKSGLPCESLPGIGARALALLSWRGRVPEVKWLAECSVLVLAKSLRVVALELIGCPVTVPEPLSRPGVRQPR
jgi:hypothetical protein